jgi:osmotically inducible protein OsmC
LSLIAAKSKIVIPDARVEVSATFARDPADGLFMITADVAASLPGVDRGQAEQLIRETEKICPYAKFVRQGTTGNVRLA